MFTCENCRRQVGSGKKMNKRIIATRPVEYYHPRDVVVGKGHETVCEVALCETCAEGFDKGIPLANMAKVASKLVALVAFMMALSGASAAQGQCWCPSPQPVVYAAPMASYTYYQPAVVIYHQSAPVVYHAAPILPQPASIPVIPALPSPKARLPVVPVRNLYPPGTTYVQ